MIEDRDAIVAAARACIGARFRPHGRSVATGLDCVGLAGIAYGVRDLPGGYALRGGTAEDICTRIAAFGLRAGEGAPLPGDLLLLAAGPYQHHLAIVTPRGFVHADAGLRRVVEAPGLPVWSLVAHWRPAPRQED